MYEVYYNLQAEPFRLSPDHKFCYEHKAYAKARAYMAYAFRRAEGFVMITGRPGTGKTTLIGELVESLSGDNVATANLVCTQLEADDLLKTVAYSFGIDSGRADKAELLQSLTVLLNRWHREGRRALLIVDEAQDLSLSAMEELRLLTNIQIGGQPLLQIFLLGQPELRDLVLSPAMEQVHQRVVAASHLQGLEVDETEAYVLHRLQAVGWQGDPAINRAIFPLIFKFSEGVPRRINLICSRLFLLGSVEERHTIDVADMRVVISELQAESLAAGSWFAEEDFLQTEEPDWAVVPSSKEVDLEQPEVHLRAVNGALPSGEVNIEFVEREEAQVEPKKKEIPSIGIAHAPFSPGEMSSNESLVQPVATDAFSDLSPEALLEPTPEEPTAEPLPEPTPEPTPEPNEISLAASLESEASQNPASSVPPSERITRRSGAAVKSGPNWSKILIVGTIFILMVALVFFLEIFVSSQDEWEYPALETMTSGVFEPLSDNTVQGSTSLDEELPATKAAVSAAPRPTEVVEDRIDDAATVFQADDEVLDRFADSELSDADVALRESFPGSDLSGRESEPRLSPGSTLIDAPPSTAQIQTLEADPAATAQKYRVTFSFDSVALMPESQAVLDDVVEILREQTSQSASITGFADSQGEEFYNLHLSRLRAAAVQKYMIEAGVLSNRLRVEGKGVLAGSSDPELSTANPEQNRMVEITIIEGELL